MKPGICYAALVAVLLLTILAVRLVETGWAGRGDFIGDSTACAAAPQHEGQPQGMPVETSTYNACMTTHGWKHF